MSSREDYMLIAAGPVNYAPFLAGWQEFKDNLRRIVEYQPGWTEVMSGPAKGQMQGWCRLERKNDAEAAYAYYTKSRGILVHLFKTSRTSGDYRLEKCNCNPHFPNVSKRGHSPDRSGIDAGGVNKYLSGAGVSGIAVPQQYVVPAPALYSYSAYQPQPTFYATPAYNVYGAHMQAMAPHMPIYSTNTNGIPVNVRAGAVLTEARGIFISGLSYKAGPKDLNALLSTVGRPVDVRLHNDRRTGRFTGSATAKFATAEEAQAAINQLNQTMHMDKIIHVRFDTEKTVVAQVQGPVIANGSCLPRVSTGTGYH